MQSLALVEQKVRSGSLSLAREERRLLALVAGLDDAAALRECKARAAAIAAYLAQRKDGSVEEYNAAQKIKARVEHRLGEVLAVTVQQGGDRKSKSHDVTLNGLPPEITRMQSSRSQQVARIPWKEIEARIDRRTEQNERASPGRIVKELIQEQRREQNLELVKAVKPLAISPGTFHAVVIDPPWDWDDEGDVSQFGRGRHEYTPATFDQLASDSWWREQAGYPVSEMAHKDAHLYLWITNRSLPKGFALLDRWGFRYVTCLTWCKPSVGMGNYFRGSTEHALFGVRGSLPLLRRDAGTWFSAARQGPHSTKPDEFYRLVESCSPGPWLELFTRKERPGWAVWGAEAS